MAVDGKAEGQVPPPAAAGRAKRWYHPRALLSAVIDQWFLIGIGVVIVLAWRFPNVGKEDGIIKSQYSIHYGAIAVIFLITGMTLSTKALINQAKHIYMHLFCNVFSFLLFPAVVYAIISIVQATGSRQIDQYILVGMMVMGVMPTTVASNITMTRNALGNTEAATIEVCTGNVLGVFLTPLLLELFLRGPWSFGAPAATGGLSGSAGLKEIYKEIGQQLGLALFLPLVVGQALQAVWPKQIKWTVAIFRLAKVSSALLLTMIWTAFSTQFAADAFKLISPASVIFVVFVNLLLYIGFTALCLLLARPPCAGRGSPSGAGSFGRQPFTQRLLGAMTFGKREATALCFCAAAKGIVLGSPVTSILYGGFPVDRRAIISIPLVLYQGEQVVIAQILVAAFRWWNLRGDGEDASKEPEELPEGVEPMDGLGSTRTLPSVGAVEVDDKEQDHKR